jgi:anti-anti-sigma factor
MHETIITLRGEIDYETAQELRTAISEALQREGISGITVSLANVTFLDSTGIGTLVVAVRICSELGVRLRVRDANPMIQRLFTVVGVAGALGVPEAIEARPANGARTHTGVHGAKAPMPRKPVRAYSMEH